MPLPPCALRARAARRAARYATPLRGDERVYARTRVYAVRAQYLSRNDAPQCAGA